jgi:hypothetical protein
MHRQRDLVLLVTLAVAAAVPARGQAIKQADSGARGAASIPDLSGVWAKPYVGIESPRSGPGPVTNRSRRNGARNVYQYVGDYTNPILKPEAAEIVKKHGEISLTGVPYPSPRNQCWPQGVPGIFPDTEIEMLQQLDRITILYSEDHEIRHIRMNEPHPVPVTPSWYGDSVGHYEGDTLVIDTVGGHGRDGCYQPPPAQIRGSPHTRITTFSPGRGIVPANVEKREAALLRLEPLGSGCRFHERKATP